MAHPDAETPSAEPDEVKRKFKEALERKQRQQHHASAESAEHDGSDKSHGATEPTVGRTFRRKSI
ncbi:MAG: DUF5302 domain-containing protein [Nocardioidaceae bacterium]